MIWPDGERWDELGDAWAAWEETIQDCELCDEDEDDGVREAQPIYCFVCNEIDTGLCARCWLEGHADGHRDVEHARSDHRGWGGFLLVVPNGLYLVIHEEDVYEFRCPAYIDAFDRATCDGEHWGDESWLFALVAPPERLTLSVGIPVSPSIFP